MQSEKTKEYVTPGSNNTRAICPIKLIVPFTTTFDVRDSCWVKHSSPAELQAVALMTEFPPVGVCWTVAWKFLLILKMGQCPQFAFPSQIPYLGVLVRSDILSLCDPFDRKRNIVCPEHNCPHGSNGIWGTTSFLQHQDGEKVLPEVFEGILLDAMYLHLI